MTTATVAHSAIAEQLFADVAQAASPASWRRKQSDGWDRKTGFIYKCETLSEVREQTDGLNGEESDYAEHRWKNFKRHDAWLHLILARRPETRQYEDPRDKTRDLYLPFGGEEITTDLKVTRYPNRATPGMSDFALASNYYQNQSGQSRFHLDNRLFIVGQPEESLYNYEAACRTVDNLDFDAVQFELQFGAETTVAGIVRHNAKGFR